MAGRRREFAERISLGLDYLLSERLRKAMAEDRQHDLGHFTRIILMEGLMSREGKKLLEKWPYGSGSKQFSR